MEAEFQRISALPALSLADLKEELAKLPDVQVYEQEMRMTTWVRATLVSDEAQALPLHQRLVWDWMFCNRRGQLLAAARDPLRVR